MIVVGILLGASAAALYAIPARLFEIAFGAGVAGTALLLPAFAELEGAEKLDQQREYLRTGLRAAMALALLFGLPLVLMPDRLIEAWIGGGFAGSTWVMVLLGLVLFVQQPTNVLARFMIARGRQRELARVAIAVVSVNLVLSIVLAETVGLWGVAFATLVTEAVAGIVLVPRLVTDASGLSYGELARAALRPVAPALVVAAVVLVGVARAFDPTTLATLLPVGILWIAGLLAAVWRFGISGQERAALHGQLGRRPVSPIAPIEGEPADI